MIVLPTDYVTSIFLQYSGHPEKIFSGYRASCPICMEGKSWGTKKRLYYFPKDGYFFCHNGCGSFGNYYWVKKVTGKSYLDIRKEIEEGYGDVGYDRIFLGEEEPKMVMPDLPNDSINLLDRLQVEYNKDNYWVKSAVSFLIKRKLMTAPYRPKTFYLSLNDYVHKNRIIIPYYGFLDKIEFYQSRAMTERQEKTRGKFLSKLNSDKSIFNLDKIDPGFEYVFLMEGAIDSMFLKNAVGISGLHMTEHQKDLLQSKFPFHKRVWIYDNHKIDASSAEHIRDVAMDSQDLYFSWSGRFEKYKDINEFCIKENSNEVSAEEVLKRAVEGKRVLLT